MTSATPQPLLHWSITISPATSPRGLFVQGRYAYVISGTNASAGLLQAFDLGAVYIQQLEAGGMEVGTLATRENMTVNNDLDVRGGATFGRGSDSTGPSSVYSPTGSIAALTLQGDGSITENGIAIVGN